jgi:hypothetical protein
MQPMRTIRERLIEGVANTLGGGIVYCDDDDIVHAIQTAAETNPAVLAWWQREQANPAAVTQLTKAIRTMATEGGSREHG